VASLAIAAEIAGEGSPESIGSSGNIGVFAGRSADGLTVPLSSSVLGRALRLAAPSGGG
jgi:hypothetical protein